jgi:protein-S-isoprenylcysteine O-methyltransferase Ste14
LLIAQTGIIECTMPSMTLMFGMPPAELVLEPQVALVLEKQLWFGWIICWLALAVFSKSTKRRESPVQRFEHLLPSFIGFILVFWDHYFAGWLTSPSIVPGTVLLLLSVALTICGLLFTFWARFVLGNNWSGTVTIKKDHQLIRRGPYRWIRHPIYTGLLAALAGAVVTQGTPRALLGFALVLWSLYRKARREESFLSQEFGDLFAEHRRSTGMFLPRFG